MSTADRPSPPWWRWVAALLLCLAWGAHAQDTYPSTTWEQASPEVAAQWSAERFKEADGLARSLQTDAYLVVHKGYIVHAYGGIGRVSNLHSMRKSVLSVLMGMGADRGKVKLDQTLAELGIDDKEGLSDAEKQATVRQLMQARSGIYHRAAYETGKMAAQRPARGSAAPGEKWVYNNWDFNALATIFAKATGQTVFESLRDDLAKPLQFEDFSYYSGTKFLYEGTSRHPAYLMWMSPRDLARIGLLMSRNGNWRGRQLVSQQWVQESTTSYSNASPNTGYGYMWWVGLNGRLLQNEFPGKVYAAEGSQGQYLLIDAARDLIIVHKVETNSDPHRQVTNQQFAELLRRILAAKITPD